MRTPARRIAISGHRGLPVQTAALIDRAIRDTLATIEVKVIGISCLADGADQIFAQAVTDLGGALEVIVPASQYRDGLPADCRRGYDELIVKAMRVHRLPFTASTAESHMAASEVMTNMADELYAVWDGEPARAYGGTADVVTYAKRQNIPIRVIWPPGATR